MSRPHQPMAGSAADRLVLASGSATRAEMLLGAGVPFLQDPADLDEAEVKVRCRRQGFDALETAMALARAKAERVAPRHPGKLVLGSDQLLDLEGHWFDKARDRDEAQEQLSALSGRSHRLATAAVLLRDGREAWSHAEAPVLRMRTVSRDFIAAYLDASGDAVLGTVGIYQLEGLGAQLFEAVEGDFFTVLGLPLLPLLAALRREGVLP